VVPDVSQINRRFQNSTENIIILTSTLLNSHHLLLSFCRSWQSSSQNTNCPAYVRVTIFRSASRRQPPTLPYAPARLISLSMATGNPIIAPNSLRVGPSTPLMLEISMAPVLL
jgi:hypothetical protein